ncbi:MAG: hypothetical protein M1825_001508 [Sarcosagium campestre]|nr:MAG: hypothetical protein M1825_001508 [Sarcosagium campestre]
MIPPSSSLSAPLPPSVEQAYRLKCIELKRRTAEVEESNDAYRLRSTRLRRGILKLRLERAFLLEQLAKRTSANVEDSEGSPSPPPTPKEKPLRTKRGHRRPSPASPTSSPLPLPPIATSTFTQGGNRAKSTLRMSGDDSGAPDLPPTAIMTVGGQDKPEPIEPRAGPGALTRAVNTIPRRPLNAYMMYCEEKREAIIRAHADEPDFDAARALAQAWRDLGSKGQKPWVMAHKEARRIWAREAQRISTGDTGGPVDDDEDDGDMETDYDTIVALLKERNAAEAAQASQSAKSVQDVQAAQTAHAPAAPDDMDIDIDDDDEEDEEEEEEDDDGAHPPRAPASATTEVAEQEPEPEAEAESKPENESKAAWASVNR